MHKAPVLGPPGPCPAFQHSLPDTLVAACPKAGLVRAKRAPAKISFLMRSSLSDYADCTLDRKWGGGKQYEPPSPFATSNLGASDAGDLMHKRATNEADDVVDPTTRRLLAGWLVVGLVMSVVRVRHQLLITMPGGYPPKIALLVALYIWSWRSRTIVPSIDPPPVKVPAEM